MRTAFSALNAMLAGRGARSRGKSAAEETSAAECFRLFLRVEDGRQELRDLSGLDALDGFLVRDELFVDHVAGDLHRRESGAFAGTRLQEIELARLNRELDVLHVAVMRLEFLVDVDELVVDVGESLFEGFLVADDLRLRDRQRRADAGDDVFALRVRQVLAEEFLLAGRRIAREGDAGRAVIAHVPEDHRLHVDGGAPIVRDAD